ncbi:MAG: hypothetical protein HC880_18695 [Bacteroidia bacterium]|nr:hypothetical protein [Bacteroidia bacterium]
MKELLSLVSDFSSDRQHLRLAIGLSSDYYILRKDQADQTLSPEEESRREKELIRRLHALLNRLETELGKDHQAA